MRKKGMAEVLVTSVMSQHEGAKTKVRVKSVLSEELDVKIEMHHGSALSPFLLAVIINVVNELARELVISELQLDCKGHLSFLCTMLEVDPQ